jgi:hypothetical protein
MARAIPIRRICSPRLTPWATIRWRWCRGIRQSGVVLHLEVGNAVPEDTCTDSATAATMPVPRPAGSHRLEEQPGILEAVAAQSHFLRGGRRLHPRFPYGQKDSYHYVLFGHSLAIPAWNSALWKLDVDQVVNGVTTIVTTDRGTGINACPSRITISGVLGSPTLNGVYNTTSCPDTKTITRGHSRRPQLELSQQHAA